MNYRLEEIFDIEELRNICESFTDLTGAVTAILDLKGKVYIATGWQSICTQFHRTNEETCKRCVESDTILASQIKKGNKYSFYQCKNGLTDVAMPIMVRNNHIGNFFTGQFFKEKPDIEYFKKQAEQFGFNEQEYLAALEKVPIYTEDKIKKTLQFLVQLTETIGNIGVKNLEIIEANKKIEAEKIKVIKTNKQLQLAQEGLKENGEKIRSYIENAPDGIFVVNEKGQYLEVNKAACDISGYSEKELLQLAIPDLIQNEYLQKAEDHFKTVVKKGFASGEFGYLTKLGEIRYWIVDAVKISDTRFLGFAKDITERKNVEQSLKQNKKTVELALGGADAGLWSWNIKTGEDLLDERWCAILGYKKEELPQEVSTWERLIHPDDKDRIYEVVQKHFEDEKNEYNHEYRMKCKNGEWKWIHAIGRVVERDPEGSPHRMTGIIIDINERKLAENELIKAKRDSEVSHHKYKELFVKMMNAFAVHEMIFDDRGEPYDYRFLEVNPAWEKIVGIKSDLVINKTVREIIPDIEEVWIQTYGRIVKTGIPEEFHDYNKATQKHYHIYAYPTDKGKFAVLFNDVTDKIISDDALRESEIRFKALHNASFGGITIHDKGLILECNKGLSEITGFTVDELIGMDGLKLIAEESRKEVMTNIRAGYEKPYEAIGIRKNGDKYPLRLEAREIPYKGKNVRVVEFRDITEQKESENKLKENEEILRNIFNNSTSVIYSHDINNVVNYVSPQVEDILGYTPEEAKVNWVSLLSDNPLNEIGYQISKKAIETGEKQAPYELEFVHKNGTKVLIEAREAPVVKDGKTVSMVGIFNDITNRKQIENELKYLTKRLQLATESANIGIWEYDLINNILVWDKQMFNLYGISSEDFSGAYEAWKAGVHPDDINRLDAEVQDAISGKKEFHTQFRVVWPNGEVHFIEAHAMVLRGSNGEPEKMTGVNWEITQRIKTEQDLRKAKEEAEHSDRLKSAFLSNMSHEIRTPMNGILGFTELLENPNLSGDKKEKYISIIKKSGDRMLDTVNDIIDISKIDAGQMEVSNVPVNIREEVVSQYEFFKEEASLKGLKINLVDKLPKGEIAFVTDRTKISSIISNLIKNAIKYTDKGSVNIYISKSGSDFRFEIIDTGIGIPKNRISYIFNRFEQADIEDTHAREGSGLGLAITKAYVEILGGNISVESKAGVGSTFIFTVPWVDKGVVNGCSGENEKIENRLKVLIKF